MGRAGWLGCRWRMVPRPGKAWVITFSWSACQVLDFCIGLRHHSVMMRGVLQLWLLLTVLVVSGGAAIACPNHHGEHAGMAGTSTGAAVGETTALPASSHGTPVQQSQVADAIPTIASLDNLQSTLLLPMHSCCGDQACAHMGACTGACCSSAGAALIETRRPSDRKIVRLVSLSRVVAVPAPAALPSMGERLRSRDRSRHLEAMRLDVSEPRLARAQRLTI